MIEIEVEYIKQEKLKVYFFNMINFSDEEREVLKKNLPCFMVCPRCHLHTIDNIYLYIVEELKKKNLLSENFKIICCFCHKRIIA
jgi:hypothetical protein